MLELRKERHKVSGLGFDLSQLSLRSNLLTSSNEARERDFQ